MVLVFGLGGCGIADGFEQSAMVRHRTVLVHGFQYDPGDPTEMLPPGA